MRSVRCASTKYKSTVNHDTYYTILLFGRRDRRTCSVWRTSERSASPTLAVSGPSSLRAWAPVDVCRSPLWRATALSSRCSPRPTDFAAAKRRVKTQREKSSHCTRRVTAGEMSKITHPVVGGRGGKRGVHFRGGLQEQQQLQVQFVQSSAQVQNGLFVRVTAASTGTATSTYTSSSSSAATPASTARARSFRHAFAEFAHFERGPYGKQTLRMIEKSTL